MNNFIICFFSLIISSFAVGQTEEVLISKIDSKFIRAKKTITGQTHSIPPRFFYKIEGFEYQITIHLHVKDPKAQLDTSLTVVCFMPDLSIEAIKIQKGRIISKTSSYYEYSFPILIKNDGWVGFTIATEGELIEKSSSNYYSRIGSLQKVFLHKATDH